MPGLIVIRIIPKTPIAPSDFANYLSPPGLGPLSIAAYDLSFTDPVAGQPLGTATFIAPTSYASPTAPINSPAVTLSPPQYAAGTGIAQQVDLQPFSGFGSTYESPYFTSESVATAIIAVPDTLTFENLKLVAQWGSGATAVPVPITLDYYDAALVSGGMPDLNGWAPDAVDPAVQLDPWASLGPSLYLQLPQPPTAANLLSFQMPTDGTPPTFAALLAAVRAVLNSDPGTGVTLSTNTPAAAGAVTLGLASVAGVSIGMTAIGAGLAAGSTVGAIDTSANTVTLNQQLANEAAAGSAITFAPNLAALSLDQCQNIAYEIIWSQQPPLPGPPDPIEQLYTNPPNNGQLLSGGSSGQANPYEGERQQFEAALQSYYSVADTNAARLTGFVYALSAAVACEQTSIAAQQAVLDFPVNPIGGAAAISEASVVLTGVAGASVAGNFGVPAAYFYALAAALPAQVTTTRRYQIATGSQLPRLLTDLTTAVNTGTITDAGAFVTLTAVSTTAAQAARRLVALGVPQGSATPLAPLGCVSLALTAAVASGSNLPVAPSSAVLPGMLVVGANILAGTVVTSVTATGTNVELSQPVLNDLPAGSVVIFGPPYAGDLQGLVADWLAYPPPIQGSPSSESYQPTDEAKFWFQAASAHANAFLGLVLSALTQDYVIPAPFNVALGQKVIDYLASLASPPTVATLVGMTNEQWAAFFTPNPTWLPPFTLPGNIAARIAAFIRNVQSFFTVETGGPPSQIDLATTTLTNPGVTNLVFAPTTAILEGMSASAVGIPTGTIVADTPVTTATQTSVSLSQPTLAQLNVGTNVTFAPAVTGLSAGPLPRLPMPSSDWLGACLSAYGSPPYTLGDGIDADRLSAAAVTVFPDDLEAQAWLVEALTALDALYAVMKAVTLSPVTTLGLVFSVVETLYARGFRSAADITALDGTSFQQALLGTIAYPAAAAIYISASVIAPHVPVTGPSGPFKAINADGLLTNCIPPPSLSPLGPVAYLHDMLQLSELSTCAQPSTQTITLKTNGAAQAGATTLSFATTGGVFAGMQASAAGLPDGTTVTTVTANIVGISQASTAQLLAGTSVVFRAPSLGAILSQRRGPVGDLLASRANLETPLPLIDIANECLEYLGAAASPNGGTVYNTASETLAGLELCADEPCAKPEPSCHDPGRLLAALPQYSTPGTPEAANAAVEPAVFDKLKSDFSSCRLPYSQALDIARTYLGHFHTCRFETMRTFRKCITEFVLAPAAEPAGFQSHLWRYPVRVDIAIDYLGITPEEYSTLFQGTAAPSCAAPTNQPPPTNAQVPGGVPTIAASREAAHLGLPAFLALTCLDYCAFYELWKSGFVAFGNGADVATGAFPECEPCCLDDYWLQFPVGTEEAGPAGLVIFIWLWRKLRESRCFCYSFTELRDICDVLHLFNGSAINPDFIRQLAAFQMLRDHFQLPLTDAADAPIATAIDVDRTHLLALWVGPAAAKWPWACALLVDRIERHACRFHGRDRRAPEFVKALFENLDTLSALSGFDPASAPDTWHAAPTHTLRFAEILSKIYASNFSIGEIAYLFTAGDQFKGDDPFPLQDQNEALDLPLDLPADDNRHSLWHLRRALLAVTERLTDDDTAEPGWNEIDAPLQSDFGFAAADTLVFGQHFFPHLLDRSGQSAGAAARRFTSSLTAADTSAAMWNVPADGPFQYDPTTELLSVSLPLTDEAVFAKLTHVHALNTAERQAVQDLFFQPRAMLARFGLLFSDFVTAERHLIEAREEHERWAYFRHAVAVARRRLDLIAEHLAHHVAAVTGQPFPEGENPALVVLRSLFADENIASAPWENDAGTTPPVTWGAPAGGAVAALLGLAGAGLIAEYGPIGGPVAWRDGSSGPDGFGHARDRANCPVPTVLPALDTTLPPQQMQFVTAHNGFLMKDATGAWLGGAQGFETRWHGSLLVDEDGTYEFWAGAPAPGHDKPDWEAASNRQWRVVLKRAQRSWTILSHHWPREGERSSAALPLRRGAYDFTAEFVQPAPDFSSDEQVTPMHSGFQVKYSGPDSDNMRIDIPHCRLFPVAKDHTLGDGIAGLSAGASAYLSTRYVSSLRDIRRSYQRAFKALLFVHRFALSAERRTQGRSELGYMLAQKANFAGASYYRAGGNFVQHRADFDLNFLPLDDDYFAPVGDMRTAPTAQRSQALFDWWERIFDYTAARREVRRRCDRHLWHLFDEAEEKAPAHPAYLLRHLGADARHWHLALRYFQGQAASVYAISSADFEDDRWTLRTWRADQWLTALQADFAAEDITVARPDLWASDDPGATVSGESESGNANLASFLNHGCLDNGEPRRYGDLKQLNDRLRERGRDALIAYLCHSNRVALPWLASAFATVPRDLSDLLLIDVEAGVSERASRIDEAVSAIQTFVRRARLGLEPGWIVTPEFARMWDREFADFRVWQECKRRQLYKENWIEWDELEAARKVEAFRFLEDRLRRTTLTVAVPGGLEWWPDQRPPSHRGVEPLQKRDASTLALIAAQPEGLDLLATPERVGRPSWLTFVTAPDEGNGGPPPSAAVNLPSSVGPRPSDAPKLPYWIEAAMRLGKRFYRVVAAGCPTAAVAFAPHPHKPGEVCATCCAACGCDHPAVIDEYYFWLVDGAFYQPPVTPVPTGYTVVPTDAETGYVDGYQTDFYDPSQQEAALWQDITQLPELLYWRSSPMVRLAWCCVHHGEFQQPRQSALGVAITPGTTADLTFLGRNIDSLTFSVSNAVAPDGYSDPSAPGFRYDMAADEAVPLPLVAPPDPPPVFPAGLPAYPYFLYDKPGTHLFPLTPFSPALAVARALRVHCRFEAALKWYRLAFDPLQLDCTWIDCAPEQVSGQARERQTNPANSLCCDATDISCEQARDRAVVLDYLETLVEWGDAVRRRRNSPEAFEQARVIFDAARLILGRPPRDVRAPEPDAPATVANFVPAFAPLNPRLLDIFATVQDRLALIRNGIDAKRLNGGSLNRGAAYFGDNPLRHGWRTNTDPCAEDDGWCDLPSPYRFGFLIQKAQDYAARAEQLGGALLAAFEKGDAEYLESLRADHERELLTLGLEAKKDQWRDADWQIEALQTSKAVGQANLNYFNGLINSGPNGLIDDELQYQNQIQSALSLRGTANVTEGIGEGLRLIPDLILGIAGLGPVSVSWIPVGTKVGEALEAVARIINNSAEIDGISAQLDQTDASWERRLTEWIHQTQILSIEIHQLEQQILGAQRRRDEALQNLNQYRRQIEQAGSVLNFLRDKFTAQNLYLFLQKETAALYYRTYELAEHAARQAQRAFNFERGHTTRHFLPECAWDNLHEGLLGGERLSAALRHMEKAYLDENVREYELTKHLSLRLHFPFEFLRLRTTGQCEIEIPEWMFDLDFPGQYMRRIKSVSLTIPCVTGPFTGVHCRLTLLDSVTRIDPRLQAPAHECCCPPEPGDCGCAEADRSAREYALCPDDPRAVRHYGACEAIATSSGQNDTGLFELSFSDARSLPFEFKGAVSRWRIELPPENNYFDLDTLTDTIIRLNYTAREGGALLGRAASDSAQRRLPGDGWRFFDVRHEFPDAWQLFLDTGRGPSPDHWLRLRLERKHFPFIPGGREIWLDKIAILFGGLQHPPDGPEARDCPCPEPGILAHRDIAFAHDRPTRGEKFVRCFAGRSWPDFYCGMVDAEIGPLGPNRNRAEIGLRLPAGHDLDHIFLLCRYSLGERCDRRGFDDGHPLDHHRPRPWPTAEFGDARSEFPPR